jgi:hypothetical protein
MIGAGSVPFTTIAEVPRIDAWVTLHTSVRVITPQKLASTHCYNPPLAERVATDFAQVWVSIEPWAPLILSVFAHDAESMSEVEETVASEVEVPRFPIAELPLPEGVDPCVRVVVRDYIGATLLDLPDLCLTKAGSEQRELVRPFAPPAPILPMEPLPWEDGVLANEPDLPSSTEPQPQPKPMAEETTAERTSSGCGIGSAPARGGLGYALLLGLALLNRRSRRR